MGLGVILEDLARPLLLEALERGGVLAVGLTRLVGFVGLARIFRFVLLLSLTLFEISSLLILCRRYWIGITQIWLLSHLASV